MTDLWLVDELRQIESRMVQRLNLLSTNTQDSTKIWPECGGEGEIEEERYVVDWSDGGYIEGYMTECAYCDGSGSVEEDGE